MTDMTKVAEAFQRGFLTELEKQADAQGLTEVEKVAIIGRLGSWLGKFLSGAGRGQADEILSGITAKGRRGLAEKYLQGPMGSTLTENQMKAMGSIPGLSTARGLRRVGELASANPRLAGGLTLGVPALGIGAFGAGAMTD